MKMNVSISLQPRFILFNTYVSNTDKWYLHYSKSNSVQTGYSGANLVVCVLTSKFRVRNAIIACRYISS